MCVLTDLLLQLRYLRRHEVLVKVPLDRLGVRRRTRVGALDRAHPASSTGVLPLDRPAVGGRCVTLLIRFGYEETYGTSPNESIATVSDPEMLVQRM